MRKQRHDLRKVGKQFLGEIRVMASWYAHCRKTNLMVRTRRCQISTLDVRQGLSDLFSTDLDYFELVAGIWFKHMH